MCRALPPAPSIEALETELAELLSSLLPVVAASPRSRGNVVVVVGSPSRVLVRAQVVARDLGTPPEDVALVTRRKVWREHGGAISTPEQAAEQRRSWRWRPGPSVVALEQPVRPIGNEWARSVLVALEPTVCRGVAEAFHKPEDLAAWSDALGGLDVVDLVDLAGTATPAAGLTGAVPIGYLEDEPATPRAWAKLLCDQLGGRWVSALERWPNAGQDRRPERRPSGRFEQRAVVS
jgi:hypothetical protein